MACLQHPERRVPSSRHSPSISLAKASAHQLFYGVGVLFRDFPSSADILRLPVFFGCCIAGACFTFLLPEVRGVDPDVVYAQELAEAANRNRV